MRRDTSEPERVSGRDGRETPLMRVLSTRRKGNWEQLGAIDLFYGLDHIKHLTLAFFFFFWQLSVMEIQPDPQLSAPPQSEISMDRQSDGICLVALEARVQEGCQNLPAKIQGNREKLWGLYLDAVTMDGPFPQGHRRTRSNDGDSTDDIPLDGLTDAETGEVLPAVTVIPEPALWIDEERPDLAGLEGEGNRGFRRKLISVILAILARISHLVSRSSRLAGTNLLVGTYSISSRFLSIFEIWG